LGWKLRNTATGAMKPSWKEDENNRDIRGLLWTDGCGRL
jgi:hypothetical protein